MFLTVRQRLRHDDGISLVEIMVSIVILAIALTAFAGTITSALATMTRDEQFVRGNQVAADLIEESRAQDWECIGLDESDPGWTTTGTGGADMVAMDTTCSPQRVNLPAHQVTIDNQTYDVVREVVWVDDTGIPGVENHKRITVTLDWSVRGNPYTATQESIRIPTPDEVAIAPLGAPVPPPPAPGICSGRITSMTISPSTVAINPSGNTAEPIVVVVETCAGTSAVTISGDQLSSRSMAASPASSTTRWELTLAQGLTNFSAGIKTWAVQASGTAPAAERQMSRQVTFYNDAGLPPVDITSISTSPGSPWCVETNGSDRNEISGNTTVIIAVSGLEDGSSGTVTMSWTNPDGTAPVTYDSASGTWRATIPAGTTMTGTDTTLYVNATRTTDNARASESVTTISINRVHQNPGCPA